MGFSNARNSCLYVYYLFNGRINHLEERCTGCERDGNESGDLQYYEWQIYPVKCESSNEEHQTGIRRD